MDTVEERLNRVLAHARVVERLLHEGTAPLLECGGIISVGVKVLHEAGVSVVADFPPHCWIEPPRAVTMMLPGERSYEPVLVRAMEAPGDGAFSVRLDFLVADSVAAGQ